MVPQRQVSPANREFEETAKQALFAGSCATGIVVGSVLALRFGVPTGYAVVLGLVAAVLNPIVAATFASLGEYLHRIAFPATYEEWSIGSKALHGAFWPVTTLFWLVVALFYASINRLFPATPAPPPVKPQEDEPRPVKPPFVVEVARCDSNSQIGLPDLTLMHPGCGGGRFREGRNRPYIECQRCHATVPLQNGEQSIGAICQTAFDAIPRTVMVSYVPSGYSEVLVRQVGLNENEV